MRDIWERVAAAEKRGDSVAVATVVRTTGSVPRKAGAQMLVDPAGAFWGTVGGGDMEARVIAEATALLSGTDSTRFLSYSFQNPDRGDVGVCGGQVEVFVQAVRPQPQVVVVGGGHVGRAVVELAGWLGLRVVVSDDRPEFCTPEALPGADAYILCGLQDLPRHLPLGPQTVVLLTTRGVEIDVEGLPGLLASDARYIGVIGSPRRWLTTAARLKALGVSPSQLARVTSPMGLELEAETPKEIALSIMAEVVMVLNGASGLPMKD